VNSYCSSSFWERYNRLPENIREEVKKSFELWLTDSSARSLYFKPVKGKKGWWSVRATASYRAVGIKDRDDIVWFFIGNHADYDRLIS
jgi:hypothetical protein